LNPSLSASNDKREPIGFPFLCSSMLDTKVSA